MLLQIYFVLKGKDIMKESVQAKLMLSAAMVIFGTLGVFTRNIGVTSGELALYRAVLASVLIGFYLVFIKKGGLNLKTPGVSCRFYLLPALHGH